MPHKRSEVMSKIKSRGSKIETTVRKILRRNHIVYRSQYLALPGKPDFFLPNYKTVIFVDSCFWHGCRYHGTNPKSNKTFWKNKIDRNKSRDAEINRLYKKLNIKVLRIWEHQLKKINNDQILIRKFK